MFNLFHSLPAAKGSAGADDSWDPSSDTPSLDKGARVTDPRTPRGEELGSDVSSNDVSMLASQPQLL